MVKYLLKFVREKEHAEALCAGELFIRPACYYHHLEQGQGDLREAAISHSQCIYKKSTIPIYCMYAVEDSDINNGVALISTECIRDFKCENGYIAVVDFHEFESKLRTINSSGYEVVWGLVNYRRLSQSDTKEFLPDNSTRHLFVKYPVFSYQKEFRVVVNKSTYMPWEPPVEYVKYHFSQALSSDKVTIVSVAQLKRENQNYILQLEK